MSGELSHLSLEELTAAARGELAASPAARHLASCESCASETRKWNAVAGGIQVLVSRSEPPRDVIGQVFAAIGSEPPRPDLVTPVRAAPPARPARDGWRGRRALRAAAAMIVLLAGGGYVASTALSSGGGHAPAQAPAALTATGCSGLKAAGGTLTSVSGSILTIRTAGGNPVTVTTATDTSVVREVAGTLGDVTDGTRVTVFGTNSGGTIAARSVALRNEAVSSLGKLPAGPARQGGPALQLGIASGIVAGAGRSGFTVHEPDGSRVQVTTSPVTTVLTLVTSRVSQLEAGELTSAVGSPGPNGTLAATMVEQNALTAAPPPLPSPPHGLPGNLPAPGHGPGASLPSPPARPSLRNPGSLFSGLGCSQEAITTTYLMSLASRGS